ncbi:MAG: CPBP family intramembrane metalloprotease, partial [Planctomycetaceae bacterium]|nr:CPBP family intramembrane metalloprotease [Planctomycetaceae bacterium]
LGGAACAGWAAWWAVLQAGEPEPPPRADHELWIPGGVDGALLLAGGILLLLWLGSAVRGRLRFRLRPLRGDAGPYGEGTALWMAAAVLLHLSAGRLTPSILEDFAGPFLLAGLAAAWPMLRGIDGRRARVALGLTRGEGIAKEAAVGLLAYPAYLLLVWAWDLLFRPARSSPEILGWLTSDAEWLRWYTLALVLVQTPVVEEVVFRGVLHRFLREAARGLPSAAGAAPAVLGSSLLFAVCHMQGWEAIPQLLIFGGAASLLREWRGSLVAPVALHAAAWADIVRALWWPSGA